MDRGVQKLHANGVNGESHDGLAPYRRLVELQRELIAAAERNEKIRRECAALQERIAAELD